MPNYAVLFELAARGGIEVTFSLIGTSQNHNDSWLSAFRYQLSAGNLKS
jgi:hypothetical protein